MPPRISPTPIPRNLEQIGIDLKIDGSGRSRGARVSDATELRADRNGLRVKTGTGVFTSASAREDHRTRARNAVLVGLSTSLRQSAPHEEGRALDVAVARTVGHLQIPDPGQAIMVGHLRALSAYAQQLGNLCRAFGLPLGTAQDILEFFAAKRSATPFAPQAVSDEVMRAVASHLKDNPHASVTQAYQAVMRTEARRAGADTKAGPAPVRIHQTDWVDHRMTELSGPPPKIKLPAPRLWTLLQVVDKTFPRYLMSDELFEKVCNAARYMEANPALSPRDAFARVVATRTEKPTVDRLDTSQLAPYQPPAAS